MIEVNYPAADVCDFSLAKLVLVHTDMQRRRIRQEMRSLWIATAGAAGGDAFKQLNREFERQLRRLGNDNANEQTEREREMFTVSASEMPLTEEDLRRQLAED